MGTGQGIYKDNGCTGKGVHRLHRMKLVCRTGGCTRTGGAQDEGVAQGRLQRTGGCTEHAVVKDREVHRTAGGCAGHGAVMQDTRRLCRRGGCCAGILCRIQTKQNKTKQTQPNRGQEPTSNPGKGGDHKEGV
jgi:hypothetical protein